MPTEPPALALAHAPPRDDVDQTPAFDLIDPEPAPDESMARIGPTILLHSRHCTWQGLLLQSYCIPAIHGGQMCESGHPWRSHARPSTSSTRPFPGRARDRRSGASRGGRVETPSTRHGRLGGSGFHSPSCVHRRRSPRIWRCPGTSSTVGPLSEALDFLSSPLSTGRTRSPSSRTCWIRRASI